MRALIRHLVSIDELICIVISSIVFFSQSRHLHSVLCGCVCCWLECVLAKAGQQTIVAWSTLEYEINENKESTFEFY